MNFLLFRKGLKTRLQRGDKICADVTSNRIWFLRESEPLRVGSDSPSADCYLGPMLQDKEAIPQIIALALGLKLQDVSNSHGQHDGNRVLTWKLI
mgnify:CR=1 FL=1